MTDEHQKLQQEHDSSHEGTLKLVEEMDGELVRVQVVISEARQKLQAAKAKYEERLNGLKN